MLTKSGRESQAMLFYPIAQSAFLCVIFVPPCLPGDLAIAKDKHRDTKTAVALRAEVKRLVFSTFALTLNENDNYYAAHV